MIYIYIYISFLLLYHLWTTSDTDPYRSNLTETIQKQSWASSFEHRGTKITILLERHGCQPAWQSPAGSSQTATSGFPSLSGLKQKLGNSARVPLSTCFQRWRTYYIYIVFICWVVPLPSTSGFVESFMSRRHLWNLKATNQKGMLWTWICGIFWKSRDLKSKVMMMMMMMMTMMMMMMMMMRI